ncbi:MAG: hypothetical protein ACRC6G_00275 [Deefgea sp.]
MTIRFRLSDQAFLQQQTLSVPMSLIEHLVQPNWSGSSLLLSARRVQQLPAEFHSIARRFIGLYVVANGQGMITKIGTMQHRLSVAGQDQNFGVDQGGKSAERVIESFEGFSIAPLSCLLN